MARIGDLSELTARFTTQQEEKPEEQPATVSPTKNVGDLASIGQPQQFQAADKLRQQREKAVEQRPQTQTVTPGAEGSDQQPGATLEPVPSAEGVLKPKAQQMADAALGSPEGAPAPSEAAVRPVKGRLDDLAVQGPEPYQPPMDPIAESNDQPTDMEEQSPWDPEIQQALGKMGFEGNIDPSDPGFQQWAKQQGIDPQKAFEKIQKDQERLLFDRSPEGQARQQIDGVLQGVVWSGPFNASKSTQQANGVLERLGFQGGVDALDVSDTESLGSLIQSATSMMKQAGITDPKNPQYRKMKNALQEAIFRAGGVMPGDSAPPEVSLALRQMWKGMGESVGRDMSHLDAGTRFYEKQLGMEGATADMAQRVGSGGFQNLQGQTLGFGTGSALEQNIAQGGGPLGSLNQLVQGAVGKLQGPDRGQLAQGTFERLRASTEPGFQQELRGVGQRAAALGRVGAGLTTSDLGTVQQRREEFLGRAQQGLASEAAGQELNDRVVSLNALLGARGQTFNQAFSQEQARLGAQQQQQGFQFAQQGQAQENAIQQWLMQQQQQQQQFQNELSLGQFNLQGLQAYGSPQQQYADPQTQAILQWLSQIQMS
jgi:hypothetical protein